MDFWPTSQMPDFLTYYPTPPMTLRFYIWQCNQEGASASWGLLDPSAPSVVDRQLADGGQAEPGTWNRPDRVAAFEWFKDPFSIT